jgi:hypothetical protein
MESGGLTNSERASVTALLEWTGGKLLEVAGGLSRPQWEFRPRVGCWSVSDIVEHLILVERSIVGRLDALVKKYPPNFDRQAETAGKEKLLLEAIPDRERKIDAPAAVVPGQKRRPLEAIGDFLAMRNGTIEYVRETNHALRGYHFNHITFQLLDGYQWLLLVAVHTERHLAQMAELKADPQFPK